MVKISSFNIKSTLGSIDGRVQSGSIDSTGAGSVARAVSSIGSKGADLANQYLLEAKKEEASDYTSTSITNKAGARKEFMDSNRGSVNSITGRLPDGRYWNEAVAKWENDYDKSIEDSAPTDLARRAYKSGEAGNSKRSRLGEQKWQFSQQQGQRKFNINDNTNKRAKILQAQDSEVLRESGSSLTQETKSAILTTVKEVTDYNNSRFSEGQLVGNNLLKSQANIAASSGVKSMLRNKEFGETLDVMGVGVILNNNKEFRALVIKDIQENIDKKVKFLSAEGTRVNLLIEKTLSAPSSRITYDLATGGSVSLGTIDINALVTKPTERVPEEFEPGLILNNVTPQQQQKFIMAAISGVKTKSRKDSRALLNKIDNNIATLEARADEEGRNSYDEAEGHQMSDSYIEDNRKYIALPDDIADETDKVNLTSRMAGAAIVSMATGLDDVFTDYNTAEDTIDNSDEAVDRYFNRVGLNTSPEFKGRVKIKVKEQIRANYARIASEVRSDPAKYIISKDEDIQVDFNTARDMEQENINSRLSDGIATNRPDKIYKDIYDSMKKRSDQLGVPLNNLFPDEVIDTDYEKIKGLQKSGTGNRKQLALFLQESLDSKGPMAESYFRQLTGKGLDKAYLLATKSVKNINSVRVLEDMSDIIEDKKLIRDEFSAKQSDNTFLTKVSILDLEREALNALQPLADSFHGSGGFNDRRSDLSSMKDLIVTSSALELGSGTDVEGATGAAYKKFIAKSFSQGLGDNGAELFISARKYKALNLNRNRLDAIAEVTGTPDYLPEKGLDYSGIVTPKELKKISESIASSGQPVNKKNTDRVIRKKIISGTYGVLRPQDSDEGVYFTIVEGSGKPQVIKRNKVNGNSKPFTIPYDILKEDSRVLKIEKEKTDNEEVTAIDKAVKFFGELF